MYQHLSSLKSNKVWTFNYRLSEYAKYFPLISWCRECSRLFGEDGMSLKVFLKRTAPFSILWTLTNYLYLLALRKLTATDVSALYCCHKAFVFLLSWIVLKDRFMGVRVGGIQPWLFNYYLASCRIFNTIFTSATVLLQQSRKLKFSKNFISFKC